MTASPAPAAPFPSAVPDPFPGREPGPLRAVFFDLDDTLIGYQAAERCALETACRHAASLNTAIHPALLARAIYDELRTGFAYGTPGYRELAVLPIEEFRRRLTGAALARVGVDAGDDLAAVLVDVYTRAEAAALHPFPDTFAVLARLQKHFRLGIITNGPSAMQRAKLADLGLAPFFEAVVVDTEFGHPKPDTRLFAYAAGLIGLPPENLLFVGNSLAYDVTGAKRAGWRSAWLSARGVAALPRHFPLGGNLSTPDWTIRRLTDLLHVPPVARALAASACVL